MIKMTKGLKDFLSKMSAGQIIASIVIVVGFLIFLGVRVILKVSAGGNNTPLIIVFLTLMFLLSRLSIIVKVGIGFLSYILFPLQMMFGPLLSFAIIFSTTAIYVWLATRPTPIDFAITKAVSSSFAQTIYLSLWTIAMIPLFWFLSVEYILAHIVPVYMLSVIIYVIFMVICLPIFAREPIPVVMINGMMMTTFQFFLISYTGRQFFMWIMSLPLIHN